MLYDLGHKLTVQTSEISALLMYFCLNKLPSCLIQTDFFKLVLWSDLLQWMHKTLSVLFLGSFCVYII